MDKKISTFIIAGILGATAVVWAITGHNTIVMLSGFVVLIAFVMTDTLISLRKSPPQKLRSKLQAAVTCVISGAAIIYILVVILRSLS